MVADPRQGAVLHHLLELIPNVGPVRARQLRQEGVRTWRDVADGFGQLALFKSAIEEEAHQLIERHDAGDVHFFYQRLPPTLRYLLIVDFPGKVTFLDIESTGLSRVYHTITVAGWTSPAGECRQEILGRNAALPGSLIRDLLEHPIAVTFNGSLFDLPFLASVGDMPQLANVDLRFLAFRLGFRGSQKVVESDLGIRRASSLLGDDAPALWFRATRGDRPALRALLHYNYLDIAGMAKLCNRLIPRALSVDFNRNSGLQKMRRRIVLTPRKPSSGIARLSGTDLSVHSRPLLRFSHCDGARPVVGLDLTGSAARPSGIASISSNIAEAAMVGSDDEILDWIVQRGPRVVSIDAPLSLPPGRESVSDDDPGRSQFGIMRLSERQLKRRGVNVYPCLLPSMQGLTARGIELAARLRSHGIAVIECYPGAAQDMLSMPRKGVGVEFLMRSLRETGLELADRKHTHDELDAVTAAVVGEMFLAEYLEVLGDESTDDRMIVPQLAKRQSCPQAAIAISGSTCAGKTEIALRLVEHGYRYGRYSQVIKAHALREKLPASRESLQMLGDRLNQSLGQRELGRQLQLLAYQGDPELIVIDGLRFPEDVSFWREQLGERLTHVHVRAERDVRRQRHLADGGSSASFGREEAHPVEAQVESLAALADLTVDNDSSDLDDLNALAALLARRATSPLTHPHLEVES